MKRELSSKFFEIRVDTEKNRAAKAKATREVIMTEEKERARVEENFHTNHQICIEIFLFSAKIAFLYYIVKFESFIDARQAIPRSPAGRAVWEEVLPLMAEDLCPTLNNCVLCIS